MKAFTVLLTVIALTAASSWPNDVCPPEQEQDWWIEKLLRHDDCDKFYKCTFGKPVEQQCPFGLWFCLQNWRCEWPALVDCEDRNVPVDTTTTYKPSTTTPEPTTRMTITKLTIKTTSPEPTTTTTLTKLTTKTTTPEPTTTTKTTPEPTTTTSNYKTAPPNDFRPNGCPINVSEHWLLPHETNCNLFYYCVWGERVLRNCPSGLHFNRVIQVCDWPNAAGCNSQ